MKSILNKRRIIILSVPALLIAGVFLTMQLLNRCPHLTAEVLLDVGREDLLVPGFYQESNRHSPFLEYRAELDILEGGKVRCRGDGYYLTHNSFYDMSGEDRLKAFGKTEDYGQLMFYENTLHGELFIYENWYEGSDHYDVFIIKDGHLSEYRLPIRGHIMSFSLSGDTLYLWRCRDDNVCFLTSLDLHGEKSVDSGAYTMQEEHGTYFRGAFFFPSILTDMTVWGDLSEETKEMHYGIRTYDYRTDKYRVSKPTDHHYDCAAPYNGGFLMASGIPVGRAFRLDLYSADLELLERREIPLPEQVDTDPAVWEDMLPHYPGAIYEGVLYGLLPTEGDACYYYAVDIETGEYLYFAKIETRDRLPTDNYRLQFWKMLLPGTETVPDMP